MIYLDNCATTVVDKRVMMLMNKMMEEDYGNPSSSYYLGAHAYDCVNNARSQLAKVLATSASNIVFTSGGTESNNLALLGLAKINNGKKHIVTTTIEHESVLKVCGYLETQGFEVDYVKPNSITRCIEAKDVCSLVRNNTLLVSCMIVNNETGELLPVKEISRYVKSHFPQTYVHCDAIQGFTKVKLKIHEYPVDLISMSAHKINGPKGVGALYQRTPIIKPLLFGGDQENGLHPGTENVPGICGFGLASDLSLYSFEEHNSYVEKLNKYLRDSLKTSFSDLVINSPNNSCPYILNFSLPGFKSKSIIEFLSFNKVYVSSSAACVAGAPSYVLKAMGLDDRIINSALRIGLSANNTIEQIDEFVALLKSYCNNKRRE